MSLRGMKNLADGRWPMADGRWPMAPRRPQLTLLPVCGFQLCCFDAEAVAVLGECGKCFAGSRVDAAAPQQSVLENAQPVALVVGEAAAGDAVPDAAADQAGAVVQIAQVPNLKLEQPVGRCSHHFYHRRTRQRHTAAAKVVISASG
jgi:hypothetical protein